MLYIMQRGLLVTLIQTLLLITFHAAPGHLYWHVPPLPSLVPCAG